MVMGEHGGGGMRMPRSKMLDGNQRTVWIHEAIATYAEVQGKAHIIVCMISTHGRRVIL